MTILRKTAGILMAALLLTSGVAHFLNPEFFNGLIPDLFPKTLVNYLTGITEILLGVGVFIPAVRKKALTGIFILMILFLPIHIIDALKEDPAIGSHTVAYIRILIQFLLIWLPWFAREVNRTDGT